jgi:hypothetical protein
MTYKKDYNELLLLLLRTLVKDALHFEEIVSGSTSRLTHLEVKMEDLKNKVSLCACFHACPSCELKLNIRVLTWYISWCRPKSMRSTT